MKALKASKTVLQGRDHVQSHFSAILNIYFMIDFVRNWPIDTLDVRSVTHYAATDNAQATFTGPIDTLMKALGASELVFCGWGRVQ